MVVSEYFHKQMFRAGPVVSGLVALVLIAGGCADAGAVPAESTASTEGAATPATPPGGVDGPDRYPPAGYAWVIFGTDTVTAEVAASAEERAEGLMYRDEVPEGTGMLFVFPDSQPRAFWMANTYVALDIAYMDPAHRIVDIIAMEPLVTDSYPSRAPAMFGLEVRQGWFAEKGIGIGAQAEIVFGVQGG